MDPKFIVFEGIDGCGKGTSIEFAKNMLDRRGIPCACVRDPGKTVIGEKIREILLDPEHTEICRETELLLYVAARAQLLAEQIEPLLKEGKWVLCDRYDLSTLTYQYIFGDWDNDIPIETITQIFVGQRKSPDRYILLDIPAEIGKKRVGKNQDRQEQKSLELFQPAFRLISSGHTAIVNYLPGLINPIPQPCYAPAVLPQKSLKKMVDLAKKIVHIVSRDSSLCPKIHPGRNESHPKRAWDASSSNMPAFFSWLLRPVRPADYTLSTLPANLLSLRILENNNE